MTKQYLALWVAIFLFPVQNFAQEHFFADENKVFDGGLIFGASITQVDGDTYSGYHKIGIHTGGTVYVHLSKIFGVSMDLLYSQKGSRGGNIKESYSVGTYIDKYYLNLNYIEVPVMLHLKRFEFLDFEAGLSYARLVSSKEWAEADVPVVIDPVLNSFKSTDLESVIGVSARLSKHWYGNVRAQYSLMPFRTWDRVPLRYMQYDVGQFNNVMVFRMIYMI